MNRKRKLFAVFTAVAVSIIVTSSTLFSASASNRFYGVEKLVNDLETNSKTYKILELVPSAGLGEIGYYVKGGEYNYITPRLQQDLKDSAEGTTSVENTASFRKKLYEGIISELKGQNICTDVSADKDNYPLFYSTDNDWAEEYFLDTTDANYHLLQFPDGMTEQQVETGTFSSAKRGAYQLNITSTVQIPSDAASTEPEYFVQDASGIYEVEFGTTPNNAKYGIYINDGTTYTKVKDTTDTSKTYYYVQSFTLNGSSTTAVRCNAAYFSYVGTGGDYDFVSAPSGRQYNVIRTVYGTFSSAANGAYKLMETGSSSGVPATAASITPEYFVQNTTGWYAAVFGIDDTTALKQYGAYTYDNSTYTLAPDTTDKSKTYYYIQSFRVYDSTATVENEVRCNAAYYSFVGTGGDSSFSAGTAATGRQYRVSGTETGNLQSAETGAYRMQVSGSAGIPATAASINPEYFVQDDSGYYSVEFGLNKTNENYGVYIQDGATYRKVEDTTDTTKTYLYVQSVSSSAASTSATAVRCDAAYFSYVGSGGDYDFKPGQQGTSYNITVQTADYGTFSSAENGAYILNLTTASGIPAGAVSSDPEYFVQNNTDGDFAVKFGTDRVNTKYGAYILNDNTYTKADTIVSGESYYYVQSFEAYSETSASDAVRCNAAYFSFAGTGGDYNYIHGTAETGKSYNITVTQVYYSCPTLVNNEWFKTKVFGVTDSTSKLTVSVETKTPAEVEAMGTDALSDISFIYLCGNNLTALPDYQGVTYNKVLSAGDISYNTLVYLLGKAATDESCPYIIDSSILSDAAAEGVTAPDYASVYSNIYKLAAILMQKNFSIVYLNNLMSLTDYSGVQWNTYFSTVLNTDNYNYVNDNIYCYRDLAGDNTVTGTAAMDYNRRLVSNAFSAKFTGTISSSSGFYDIAELIASENAIRSGADIISTDISQATAVQYIIDRLNKRTITNKKTINVLDIEPCTAKDLTEDDVRGFSALLEDKTIVINITSMSTAEFIGKIADLNTTYDIIYIGANVSQMYTDGAGMTKYNDTDMNGLIYTHVGDKVTCEAHIGGMLDTDYTSSAQTALKSGVSYRYSGNDITADNLEKLKQFIAGKYAVVVDSRLYTTASGSRMPNSATVDNSSNLYQFLLAEKDAPNMATATVTRDNNGAVVRNTNGIAVTLDTNPVFSYYINMPKLKLTAETPTDTTENSITTLSWNFTLSSEVEVDADTSYDVNLFFDLNADGKFSSTENMSDIVIYQNGSVVNSAADGTYHLKTGSYQLTRILAGDFTGALPWKLEATQITPQANKNIRASQSGYKALQIGATATVKILQIMPDKSGSTSYWGYWNMQASSKAVKTYNKGAPANFSALLSSVAGFTFDITSLTESQYYAAFDAAAATGENYLDRYNMIIVGFADVYTELNNTYKDDSQLKIGHLTAIQNFIESGKSVLFTHDTTSFVNANETVYRNAGGPSFWGYSINRIMRNIVGMDRFGVTEVDSSSAFTDSAKLLRKGIPLALTKNNTDNSISSGETIIDADDIAYTAKSNRTTSYAEVQGYSNNLLNRKKSDSNQQYNLKNISGAYALRDNGSDGDYRMQVAKVNSGVITDYPFSIGDTITVAPTHYQYYQLDLEADDDSDKESDIVVWYTIAGTTNTSVSNMVYNITPQDVRNNYYIYSKGNVMYSGVGHKSVVWDSTTSGNLDEAKLFINTMVAAYKNGVQSPVVTSLSGTFVNSPVKTSEQLAYDPDMTNSDSEKVGKLDKTLTLNYSVFDSNLTTGSKTLTVEYYVRDDANQYEGDDSSIITGVPLHKLSNLTTYNANTNAKAGTVTKDGVTYDTVESGNVYTTTLADPYALLGDKTQADIYIVVKSSFTYYGKTVDNLVGYSKLAVMKTQLFNLD